MDSLIGDWDNLHTNIEKEIEIEFILLYSRLWKVENENVNLWWVY
jgi:hypothetical protein